MNNVEAAANIAAQNQVNNNSKELGKEIAGEVIETVADIAVESAETISDAGEVVGDVAEAAGGILENLDDLPIAAIIGIIAGVTALIGGIIFIVKKIIEKK